jgi:hypothetical protein
MFASNQHVLSSRIRRIHIIVQESSCLLINVQAMNVRGSNADSSLDHVECSVPRRDFDNAAKTIPFRGKMNQAETTEDIASWPALLHMPEW